MNLKNSETFVWAANLGSFTAAADRLGATQPAISARIAALEEELGAKLFERSGRRLHLTAAGQDLLPRAERYIALAAEIRESVGNHDALSGLVRLGTSETLVHDWLPDLVKRLHTEHPGISLEVHVDLSVNMREQLVARELDIAFLLGPVSEPTMNNQALCEYEMAWVASPAMQLPDTPLSLAELAQLPIITFLRQTRPHIQLRQALSKPELPAPRISGSSSVATMVRMAEDGVGIAAVPLDIVRSQIADGRLLHIQTDLPLANLSFTSTWPANPANPLAILVGEMANDEAAKRRTTGA